MDPSSGFLGGLLSGAGGVLLLVLPAWAYRRWQQRRRALVRAQAEQSELASLRSELLRHTIREQSLHKELERLNLAASDFERFVGRLAQALHTPLQNASGFAGLLAGPAQDGAPGAGSGDYHHYLGRSLAEARQLLEALLELSLIGQEHSCPVPVKLAQCWQKAQDRHAERIAALQAEFSADNLPEVRGDPRQLGELFARLIDNALKFQPPGQRPRIRLQARRRGGDWHLTLTDNGIGIPWGRLETVFLPLQRLNAQEEFEGAGLGLAVCRKILQLHGGQIWAEPHEGGAQFHLVLPALARPRAEAPVLEAAGPSDLSS